MEEKIVRENNNKEPTFADLMKGVTLEGRVLKPGQKVKATIVAIMPEGIFLDVGGKSEGYLDRKELEDESGNLTVREGDTVEAFFVTARDDQRIFTTRMTGGDMMRAYLHEAWQNRVPVEGVVEKEVKGGFSVQIIDSIRGFCPFSQMGLHRIENPADYVGQRLSFIIKEISEKGRNIILSNRAVLKEEQRRRREYLKKTLQEGMMVHGRVTALQDFGAFVDIDGVYGLLPSSEVSWERVKDIREMFTVGQELDLMVIRLDWQKNRITLSLKKTLPDPWENIDARCLEGSRHAGKVTGTADFGVFVSLEPGVEGLIHISNLGKKVKHPGEAFAAGQTVEVQVERVDREKRRISLIPVDMEFGKDAAEKPRRPHRQKKEEKKEETRAAGLGSLGEVLKDEFEQLKEKKE